ncbi:MAG: amidohydrolase [Clostridiaceae bacterium]|nr:amidohydrolase [Clostridiaceae bacterium]
MLQDKIVSFRRILHQYPELSNKEYGTCKRIKEVLCKYSIEPDSFSEPAVIATLNGGKGNGPSIAIRADMDALPIKERSGVEYASLNPGVMHACGHDAHTAMAVGALLLLKEHLHELRGSVRFIFQPSEEKHPGGAQKLIAEGVLENPKINAIFAHHVQAHIEVGHMGVKKGAFMASSAEFTLIIKGKSGHAAHPQRGIDSIVIAAQVIMALQTISSRLTAPTIPVVLSICKIEGGTKANILAGEVIMKGTTRVLDEEVRKKVHSQMYDIVENITRIYGAEFSLQFEEGYPVVRNDAVLTDVVKSAGEKILGEDKVFEIESPSMGGEDFSRYQQYCPGVITNLGCGNKKKGIIAPIHSDSFLIDEDCLTMGAAILAQVAYDFLS